MIIMIIITEEIYIIDGISFITDTTFYSREKKDIVYYFYRQHKIR